MGGTKIRVAVGLDLSLGASLPTNHFGLLALSQEEGDGSHGSGPRAGL